MKRAMLYISAICFSEITSADATFTEHSRIYYPDALYVNTSTISGISQTRTGSYKSAIYIAPLNPCGKEQGRLVSVVINAVANLSEENSSRKKPRKRHPSATGKDDPTYNPNIKNPRVLQRKIPP